MFNSTSNTSKLIKKSQSHKSIFIELKRNLIASNLKMVKEDESLVNQKHQIEIQQKELDDELLANSKVVDNINTMLDFSV
tara:strand:- start:640 stop:879 length:240 start_codon:yes stop_codon:yes gene_type:complete